MKLIRAYIRAADALNEKIGYFVSWLSTLLVLIVCYDVFTRYVLNSSKVAVQEMEWHLFALIFLIGAAYTLKEDGHVRVDVFYSRMSPRNKAMIDFFGSVVFLIPFSILVIATSLKFVEMSWMIREVSPDPGGLPARYLLKGSITVGFILVLIQGIAMALRSLLTLIGHPLDASLTKDEEVGHG